MADRIAAMTDQEWVVVAREPHGQLQPEMMPYCGVYLPDDDMNFDGDPKVAEPRFLHDVMIGVSIVDKAGNPDDLGVSIDDRVDAILNLLLRDMTFFRFSGRRAKVVAEAWKAEDILYWDSLNRRATLVSDNNMPIGTAWYDVASGATSGEVYPLFESIERIRRTREHPPKDGETYFTEVRMEWRFQVRSDWPPVITDPFETMHITTQYPMGGSDSEIAGTPQVVAEWDIPQN